MEGNSMVLDIQRFAEGGAEGSGSAVTGAEIGQPQTTGESSAKNAAAQTASAAGEQKSAGNSSGKGSTSSTASGPPSPQGEGNVTLDSIFEKYPELKKEADKRAQKAIKSRVHQINKSMQSTNDIIDKLMVFHGVQNVDELGAKLNETLPEEFAIQNGVSEDVGREMMSFRTQKLQDDRARSYYESQMRAERQMQQWDNEAKEVKEIHPDFNLEAELENEEFSKLLKRGISMKHAYEVLHMDEITAAAERKAAEAYSKSVNANLKRPAENGSGNQSAVTNHSDVSKLTKKERADIAKRAARGETITFG